MRLIVVTTSALLSLLLLLSNVPLTISASSFNNRGDKRNDPYNLLQPRCRSRKEPKSADAIKWTAFAIKHSIMDTTENHVVIPCDTTVIIEAGTHLVLNGGLAIRGKLLFEEGSDDIIIESIFVLVLGWMTIGSSKRHHQSNRVFFTLLDHPKKASLVITEGLPAAYDFGRKAFVVLGGKVSFHGTDMSGPVYVHLEHSAFVGEKKITVMTKIEPYWKEGDTIGIASGSTVGDMSSQAVIIAVKVVTKGEGRQVTELTLQHALERDHIVRSVTTTGKEPQVIWLRPEVVKLNRNIIIQGSNENNSVGGHFMISHTMASQVVEGVEFVHMGQAGKAGRYPIHFHFGGYIATDRSHITRNSIHDSMQRCIVVHATHDLLVNENVSFRTHGHCYMTEDGIETGNRFIGNVAMDVRKAIKSIPVTYGDAPTDKDASGFWFAGPTNHIIDNVVAGGYNSGFWYESFGFVGGESALAKLPGYNTIDMKKEPFGEFRTNVAHSVIIGLNPGYGRAPTGTYMIFQDFFAWSTSRAFHSGGSVRLGLSGATIVDFLTCGVSAVNSDGFILENSLIIGEIEKPKHCDTRDVSGFKLSPAKLSHDAPPASAFLLKDVHFQHLSKDTNCQSSNTAVEIFLSKEQSWGVNSVANGITFDPDNVDTRWVVHNFHDVEKIGIISIRVEGDGTGSLNPGGTIVNVGWENWDVVTAGCYDMEPMGEGFNVVYCPHSCWRQVDVEFEEKLFPGTSIEIYSMTTGKRWVHHSEQRNPSDDKERVVKLILPVGNYEIKMIGLDGEPLDAMNMPQPRSLEMDTSLGYTVCPGSIGLTITNTAVRN